MRIRYDKYPQDFGLIIAVSRGAAASIIILENYKIMNSESTQKENYGNQPNRQGDSWGPKLFYFSLIGIVLFFYWLLIYPHGVINH